MQSFSGIFWNKNLQIKWVIKPQSAEVIEVFYLHIQILYVKMLLGKILRR
jgi:hypothetical protein